jgi:demethylmenaquinone methyltransferase / 2-methoxy-6-polyprenyl-1,4-benzoquinol methylase
MARFAGAAYKTNVAMTDLPSHESERAEAIRAMFSAIAPGYDRANRWMTVGLDSHWRSEAVTGLLPSGASSNCRVLDLCAGTLASSMEIHRHYPGARIVALDFSEAMLAQGARQLAGRAAQQIATKTASAERTGEADASYDAIFCAFGLRNLTNLEAAIAESVRCLKKGGRLAVLEFFRPGSFFSKTFFTIGGRLLLPVVGGMASGNPSAYTYLRQSIQGFITLGSFQKLLEQNGFRVDRIQSLKPGLTSVISGFKR